MSLSLDQILTISAIAGSLITAVWTLAAYINRQTTKQTEALNIAMSAQTSAMNTGMERVRKEGEEGRSKLYDFVHGSMDDIRKTFVHKEVHASDMRLMTQADTERAQQIAEHGREIESLREAMERRHTVRQ